MKNIFILTAIILLSSTAFANASPVNCIRSIPLYQQCYDCSITITVTVSSSLNGSYFGLVGGAVTTTLSGSMTVSCAEAASAISKLKQQLTAMLPKRADGLEEVEPLTLESGSEDEPADPQMKLLIP